MQGTIHRLLKQSVARPCSVRALNGAQAPVPPPTGGPSTWGLTSETVRRAIAHRLIRACGSAVGRAILS